MEAERESRYLLKNMHTENYMSRKEENDGPERESRQVHFQSEQTEGTEPVFFQKDGTLKMTTNMKTVEKLPHIDHYRNMMSVVKAMSSRPTLDQLREGARLSNTCAAEMENLGQRKRSALEIFSPSRSSKPAQKLGWIQGVLIRCILCIFGVILYLRLAWITAHAGVVLTLIIILLASTVTMLTTLSLCAISTNGEVKGGGAYFLLSRSLGPEFGGSIGLLFSFANAVAVSMYVVGFAESVVELMNQHGASVVDGRINDVRIISFITAAVILAIVIIGVMFETKAQIVLLIVLSLSILNFFIGTFVPKNEELQAKGLHAYSWHTFSANLMPEFRSESFFGLFAVYFPAATGIMAGANISGDLKEPHTAIPKGTILAIIITTIIYMFCVIAIGFTCLKDASGSLADLYNGTLTTCAEFNNCTYGSMNYFQIMESQSLFPPLVTAGIFAASLSSALSSMVSAPKTFQALCKDNLFPVIGFFRKGYGRNNEPRPGYLLTFVIACAIIAIGDLNSIAPIISNFFLASYALINYACFDASYSESPGFRPAFKFYNMWLSLCGAILCVVVMIVSNWWSALLTLAIMLMLYVFLLRQKLEVNWGSSGQANAYRMALNAMLRLSQTEEHVKNYRPQILVLTGELKRRAYMIDFATSITKENSLLICLDIVIHSKPEQFCKMIPAYHQRALMWLRRQKYRAFFQVVAAKTLREGTQEALQTSGLGKLKPNIMLIGFKYNWKLCASEEVEEYVNIIDNAFEAQFGVCVLRTNLNVQSSTCSMEEEKTEDEDECHHLETKILPNVGNALHEAAIEVDEIQEETAGRFNAIRKVSIFQQYSPFLRIKKATIDVYWLYDDGGLTLLLPHLLTLQKSYLENAQMRVFTIASGKDELECEETSLAALLSKFRVKFSEVTAIPNITKPRQDSIDTFNQFVQPLVGNLITQNELDNERRRTYRYLRLREFMLDNSMSASLIVTTMPVPRINAYRHGLYMVWLDLLTRELPTVLLVRGNQQSVLTFYS